MLDSTTNEISVFIYFYMVYIIDGVNIIYSKSIDHK